MTADHDTTGACRCGDRPAMACPREREPGCDLGANAEHVRQADILAKLQAAAARKWTGDPSCQQAGLFARAASEIAMLRADLKREHDDHKQTLADVDTLIAAEREALRTLVQAVRAANASAQTDGQCRLLTHAQEMAWRRLIDALDGPNDVAERETTA